MLFQQINALLGDLRAFAFVFERACDHGHRQNTHFFGNFGNYRRRARACAAAHAGGDEEHIRAADGFGNGFAVFQCGIAPHFRICTRTQTARQTCP